MAKEIVKLMCADRTVVELTITDHRVYEVLTSRLGYVQANDLIWVPACDLAQYEAGRRPIREEK